MPLPTDPNAEWPPRDHQRLNRDMEIADAWWSGDPDRLAQVYGALTGQAAHEQRRPSVASRVSDWFWGRSVDSDRRRRERIHVPAAADISATGADLLFGGDDVHLQIADAHDGEKPPPTAVATEDHLTALTDRIGLGSRLLEAAELCGALGGVYLRPTWDPTSADHPLLSVIHADRAVPEWRWQQLAAVTFWSVVEDTGVAVWRHLERHETDGQGRPVILHGLYLGTRTHLGRPMPLADQPATAGLDVDSDGAVEIPDALHRFRLLARYVPNVRPNRRHRHQPVGRPDTQGVESLMSSLDETMTSWMRDLRLGQRRIVVPDQYLERHGRGGGADFDLDREVFSPLSIDPGSADSGAITPVDFELRTAQHNETALALFERIVASSGYSPQSFGALGDGAVRTATEIEAREDRSHRTTMRKRRYWGPAVDDSAHMLLCIDAALFGAQVDVDLRPRLLWPDLDDTSIGDVATSVELIRRAEAASIETRVRLLHPSWDQTEIQAEVRRIQAETGTGVDDPTGGLP